MKLKKMFLLALIVLMPFGFLTASQATTIEFTTSGGASFTWTTALDADFLTNFNVGVFHISTVSFNQSLTQVAGSAAVYTAQLGGSGWSNTNAAELGQTLTVTVLSDSAALHANILSGVYDVSGTTTQHLVVTGTSNSIVRDGGIVVGSVVGLPGSATYDGLQPFNELGFSSTFQFASTTGTFSPSLSLTATVPEPSTLLLLGFGLAGVGLFRVYRKKQ